MMVRKCNDDVRHDDDNDNTEGKTRNWDGPRKLWTMTTTVTMETVLVMEMMMLRMMEEDNGDGDAD